LCDKLAGAPGGRAASSGSVDAATHVVVPASDLLHFFAGQQAFDTAQFEILFFHKTSSLMIKKWASFIGLGFPYPVLQGRQLKL
jgi:hypothetical protein